MATALSYRPAIACFALGGVVAAVPQADLATLTLPWLAVASVSVALRWRNPRHRSDHDSTGAHGASLGLIAGAHCGFGWWLTVAARHLATRGRWTMYPVPDWGATTTVVGSWTGINLTLLSGVSAVAVCGLSGWIAAFAFTRAVTRDERA